MAQYNTRILNKNDIEENWNKATNFIPKKGEIIVYNEDTNRDFPLIKVGDGVTNVINLPFLASAIDDGELGGGGGGLINIPLSEASWQQIAQNAETGQANTIWNVGDEITFNLKDGNPLTMPIVGFNHDDLADGSGKAGITFGMKNLYYSRYPMNSSNTNSGGWEECKMRTSTMQTIFENLPDELQAVIKTVKKKATAGSRSTSITTSQDKLWLYSQVEVFGGSDSGYKDEGTQYEYWASHNTNSDRIKNLNNGTGSASYYWLRSPSTSHSTFFRSIYSDGNVGYTPASDSNGLCFCFCI